MYIRVLIPRNFAELTEAVPIEFKYVRPCPEVIKLFSYSTQLSTKFILLINVKMPTLVGILTFIIMINTTSDRLKARNSLFVDI